MPTEEPNEQRREMWEKAKKLYDEYQMWLKERGFRLSLGEWDRLSATQVDAWVHIVEAREMLEKEREEDL